jgi:organic radical activating enzyme
MNKRIRVTSIFYSIQGEGQHVGVPSLFIRLHGCNLKCSFCDDNLHRGDYTERTFDEIYDSISKYECKRVVITGGEPSLYNLNPFIKYLKKRAYYVCVESNGYSFANIQEADWITYSPKEWYEIEEYGYDELKFIVGRDTDIEKIVSFETDKPIYIQPMNHFDKPDMQSVKRCVDLVLQYPHLRLSVQLHKFLGLK